MVQQEQEQNSFLKNFLNYINILQDKFIYILRGDYMEEINNYIDIKSDDVQPVGDLEIQKKTKKERIDEILDGFGEVDDKEGNSINFLDILKNPIIQPFIKQGLEILLKSIAKEKMTQLVAAKGSAHIADNLLNLTGRPSYRSMKKKGVKKKKQYRELIKNREKFMKENFRGIIEEQIKNIVKNKIIF